MVRLIITFFVLTSLWVCISDTTSGSQMHFFWDSWGTCLCDAPCQEPIAGLREIVHIEKPKPLFSSSSSCFLLFLPLCGSWHLCIHFLSGLIIRISWLLLEYIVYHLIQKAKNNKHTHCQQHRNQTESSMQQLENQMQTRSQWTAKSEHLKLGNKYKVYI